LASTNTTKSGVAAARRHARPLITHVGAPISTGSPAVRQLPGKRQDRSDSWQVAAAGMSLSTSGSHLVRSWTSLRLG